MALEFTTSCRQDAIALFRMYKRMGEGAMAQLEDGDFTRTLDPEMNSVATIVKHVSGNMRSRFKGFPEADGEKPDRNRDGEFETPPEGREAVMAMWEQGWEVLFAALDPLADADLSRTTMVRGEPHSVLQAIHRQVAHYAYHIGQIVFLSKHLRAADWHTLSIPRRGSAAFNRLVTEKKLSQR